jgi:hypothetical protein
MNRGEKTSISRIETCPSLNDIMNIRYMKRADVIFCKIRKTPTNFREHFWSNIVKLK